MENKTFEKVARFYVEHRKNLIQSEGRITTTPFNALVVGDVDNRDMLIFVIVYAGRKIAELVAQTLNTTLKRDQVVWLNENDVYLVVDGEKEQIYAIVYMGGEKPAKKIASMLNLMSENL